jgi:hypothetical protein
MKIGPMLAASLCATAMSSQALAAAAQPDAGYYRALIEVTSAKGSGCSTLGYAVGAQTVGFFFYPGVSKAGAVMRFGNDTATRIGAQTFPMTPLAGATSWSGTVKDGYEPSGPYFSFPFAATITYLDSQSFSAVFSANVAVSLTLGCQIQENILFLETGSGT